MIRGLRGVLAAVYERQDRALHAMTGDTVEPFDLFAEFGNVATEYGWIGVGQPLPHVRRYGITDGGLQVTVSVYANRSGTAITSAERRTLRLLGPYIGDRTVQRLHHRDSGKRDRVIGWLRRVA